MELDRFIAFSVRGQYQSENGISLFLAPTYANAKFTASASKKGLSVSISDDSWEFGFGGGVGYSFNKTIGVEAVYESFDGTDVMSLGLKYSY